MNAREIALFTFIGFKIVAFTRTATSAKLSTSGDVEGMMQEDVAWGLVALFHISPAAGYV